MKVAVLLSGTGRTLENLLDRCRNHDLPVEVVAVSSNKAGVRGLEIAGQAQIPTRVFPLGEYPDRLLRDAAQFRWLHGFTPECFLLAGYLALLDLREAGDIPILNIHPALLPKYGGKGYYGSRVHEAVLKAGEKISGCTVHLVDPLFDHGRILAQREVPVMPGDDTAALAARVFQAECRLYPQVLGEMATGKLVL